MPDGQQNNAQLFSDNRLKGEELVLGVLVDSSYVAYPLATLKNTGGILNTSIKAVPIVVLYDASSNSAISFS